MKKTIQQSATLTIIAGFVGLGVGCTANVTAKLPATNPSSAAAKTRPALKPIPLAALPKAAAKSKPVVTAITPKLSVKAQAAKVEVKAKPAAARLKSGEDIAREMAAYTQALAVKLTQAPKQPAPKSVAGVPKAVIKPAVTLPKAVVSAKFTVASAKSKVKNIVAAAAKVKKSTRVTLAKSLGLRTLTPSTPQVKATIAKRRANRLKTAAFDNQSMWFQTKAAYFRVMQDADNEPADASMSEVENPDIPGQKIDVIQDSEGNVTGQVSVDKEADGSLLYGVSEDSEGDTGSYKETSGADGGADIDFNSEDPGAGGGTIRVAAGDPNDPDSFSAEADVADPNQGEETDWMKQDVKINADGSISGFADIVNGDGETGNAKIDIDPETGRTTEIISLGDVKMALVLDQSNNTGVGQVIDADGNVVATVIVDSNGVATLTYSDDSTETIPLK
ncbi:MAG: hypothetical protein H7338_21150 [Candidatus Sericytochromatia bacterium]|nr:hypothetical protein [Candidatus Sericytochromatia bacterium]